MGGRISRDAPYIFAFENFDFRPLLSDVEWPFYFRLLKNIIERLTILEKCSIYLG